MPANLNNHFEPGFIHYSESFGLTVTVCKLGVLISAKFAHLNIILHKTKGVTFYYA